MFLRFSDPCCDRALGLGGLVANVARFLEVLVSLVGVITLKKEPKKVGGGSRPFLPLFIFFFDSRFGLAVVVIRLKCDFAVGCLTCAFAVG